VTRSNRTTTILRAAVGFGVCLLAIAVVRAQNTGGDANAAEQLPVGQTFKDFTFPIYQNSIRKAILSAAEATGMTINRAATTDLKIQIYDNGFITTTVTSPKADLYVAEQKMRTKDTVRIDRSDMLATAQDCDFDLLQKVYLLRNHVHVLLKNFDISSPPPGAKPTSTASAPAAATPAPSENSAPAGLAAPIPPRDDSSLLESPGSYAGTNTAPEAPSNPDTK